MRNDVSDPCFRAISQALHGEEMGGEVGCEGI